MIPTSQPNVINTESQFVGLGNFVKLDLHLHRLHALARERQLLPCAFISLRFFRGDMTSLDGLAKAATLGAYMSSTLDVAWAAAACIDGSRGTLNAAGSTCATAANAAQANWLSVQVAGGTRVGTVAISEPEEHRRGRLSGSGSST